MTRSAPTVVPTLVFLWGLWSLEKPAMQAGPCLWARSTCVSLAVPVLGFYTQVAFLPPFSPSVWHQEGDWPLSSLRGTGCSGCERFILGKICQ